MLDLLATCINIAVIHDVHGSVLDLSCNDFSIICGIRQLDALRLCRQERISLIDSDCSRDLARKVLDIS